MNDDQPWPRGKWPGRSKLAGRPSLGDREYLRVRLPRRVADAVRQRAESGGLSLSECLAALIEKALALTD